MRATTATLLALIPFACADPAPLKLFHRLYNPTVAYPPFSERGSVLISENNVVSFQPSLSYAQDLITFAEALGSVPEGTDLTLYQVALEREGHATETQWDISSVKACYLHQVTSEIIYLHTLDPHSSKPYAINYFVSPIPHGGACTKSRSKKTNSPENQTPFHSFIRGIQSNTTVVLQSTRHPPLPELTAPPPLSVEGEPIVPVPEKTFLQKYWIYIVLLLFALMITGGGEEEQRRK